ncbi:hypothetical protein HY450_02395 [Candidatus Pacearchaeota archaeon]|nr:hypothetical protein [Candidatus Pacearchaeota archaeon]
MKISQQNLAGGQGRNFVNMERLIVIAILVVFFSTVVNAFGISSSYWRGNPYQIPPGETGTVGLRLQNMGTDEDVTVRARLVGGGEIANVDEKDYLVKAGTKDTEVLVEIKIPETDALGTKYVVTVTFETLSQTEQGVVSVGTGIDTSFDVLVVEAPPASSEIEIGTTTWIIVAVIIIILAIFIIWLVRKGKKPVRKSERAR